MKGIVAHWTAGTYEASSIDKAHYHFLVDGDCEIHRGDHAISENVPPLRSGHYAAHTRRANSYRIGISACSMYRAKERPFDAGDYPLTAEQFTRLAELAACLCRRYDIPVTPETVLFHAEVQDTLGIRQRAKWDIARLPYDDQCVGAHAVGDRFRYMVRQRL